MNCCFEYFTSSNCDREEGIRRMTSTAMDFILEVDPTVRWDLCPAEILIIIFEKLDITSLRCCSLVNRRWKELVCDICELKDLWKDFAEDGIANFAVTHRSKSLLSWKELYFNSLLWNDIESATIKKKNEIDKLIIKSIYAYKDNIIIVSSTNVAYYNVESFQLVGAITVTCDSVEESDDMIVVGSKNGDYFRLTLFGKLDNCNNLNNIEKHFHGEPYHDACEVSRSWRWKLHNNACYIIDFKSILWRAHRIDDSWHVKSLARYFGVYQDAIENSISVMHIYKQDVFVSFKFGDLMRVDRNTIEFRRVHRPEIPTHVITGPIINRKPYKKGLDKFNAFLTAPFGVGFDPEFTAHEMIHFYYDDPTLACGMQHGEVVFLGYDDGRVAIILLKNYTEPVRIFNIKDFEKRSVLLDPAVTGLDVCEIKNKHLLFVKTNSKMYVLLIEYPDNSVEAMET